ncbi:hypothetical protein [Umezawaea sp. Da 62-37]|uniref:hypothetical protein n=1 Tax=Umezawaea sp. Da 62-37 TaxID=3075927 RepID=UPI0028F6D3E3|nr:hypothetical protein [Umezawaea sp. Da 62-37]WNV85469.1 hypothetical protein RM788_46355 [Umezawaea sp. Da 62-37]
MTAPVDVPPLRPTRTRTRLTRLFGLLLATTLVMLAVSLWVVLRVLHAAQTVHDHTTTAVLEVAAARAALSEADRSASEAFRTGAAKLAGPGQDYANSLARASQSLAKVAEANQAGDSGAGILQVVEGLVAAYSGAVGQADAHFRQPGTEVLGVTDLWYSSRLLHGPDGVLAQLTTLQGLQRTALDQQLDDGMSTGLLPVWLLAPAAAAVVLVTTQWHLWRRFRRRFNLPLLGATALTVGVGAIVVVALGLQLRLDDVRAGTDEVLAHRQIGIVATDTAGRTELATLLTRHCDPVTGCGSTVADFLAQPRFAGAAVAASTVDEGIEGVTAGARDAAESDGIEYLVPAFSIAALGLIAWGMSRRVDEYRYRA